MNNFKKFLETKRNTRECLIKITHSMYRSKIDQIVRLIEVPGVHIAVFIKNALKSGKKLQAKVKNWAIEADISKWRP